MSLSDSVPLSSVKPSGPGRAYERYSYNSQPKWFHTSALKVPNHVCLTISYFLDPNYNPFVSTPEPYHNLR